jgi:hypothetical protein
MASWYNEPNTKRYTVIPWPDKEGAELDALIAKTDLIASLPDTKKGINTVAHDIANRCITTAAAPANGSSKKRGASKKRPAAESVEVDPSIPPLVDPTAEQLALWTHISKNARELGRSVQNGDWDVPLRTGAIREQILCYIELEQLVVTQSLESAKKKGRPAPVIDPELIFQPPVAAAAAATVVAAEENDDE